MRIDGRTCRSRDLARPGHVLEVDPAPPPSSDAEPDASVIFHVMYEDAHLMVVDKPAGLVVHTARGHSRGTLVNGLLARPGFIVESAALRADGGKRPGIVHRIDKDTSGILVIAKDEQTREGLKAQLAAHQVERRYLCLTRGVPPDGMIDTLYARHPRFRLRFTSITPSGRRAISHIRVTKRLASGRAALVECRLETGRTHQIRVHLTEQTRTPLLGDPLYGPKPTDPDILSLGKQLGRQALHAKELGFWHPVLGRPMRFESPLPADMAAALAALEALTDR